MHDRPHNFEPIGMKIIELSQTGPGNIEI